MSVTIRRPLYSGSGFALYNGSGLALGYYVTVESLEQAIFDLLTEVRAVLGGPNSSIAQELGLARADAAKAQQYAHAGMALSALAAIVYPPVGAPAGLVSAAVDALTEEGWDADATVPTTTPATQLANIYDGTQPVTPVTPPPAGYGGSTALEVWGYDVTSGNRWEGAPTVVTVLDQLQQAAAYGRLMVGQQGVRSALAPDWIVYGYSAGQLMGTLAPYGEGADAIPGPVDWADWNGTDDLLTFLAAEFPTFTFTRTGPEGAAQSGYVWSHVAYGSVEWIRCAYHDSQLPYLSGKSYAAELAGGSAPPVWPGLANVTLGVPVAFDAPGEIEGPMAGVLVDYTVAPQKVDQWTVGGFTNYGHAGQLAFVSDNGYAEPWQYLQWGKQVYVPRALSVAASCLIRPIAGQEGTVMPWTVT